jgi:hypothetical protein
MNTKVKTSAKPRRGRPSKYRLEYAEQARKLCLLGLTDGELGDFFGVDEATIHRWKHTHKDFCESILTGKMLADSDVADSLYKSAVGGHFISEERPVGGENGPASVQPLKRQVAPSVQAQSLWLRNRQPRLWRDKIEVQADITTSQANIDAVNEMLREKLARQAAEHAEAMRNRESLKSRLGIGTALPDGAD